MSDACFDDCSDVGCWARAIETIEIEAPKARRTSPMRTRLASRLTRIEKNIGAVKRRDHGKETLAAIGRSYNVSGWTISRLET